VRHRHRIELVLVLTAAACGAGSGAPSTSNGSSSGATAGSTSSDTTGSSASATGSASSSGSGSGASGSSSSSSTGASTPPCDYGIAAEFEIRVWTDPAGRLGDVNGDGTVDYVYVDDDYWTVWMGVPGMFAIGPPNSGPGAGDTYGRFLFDANADGRADLLMKDGFHLSNGVGFDPPTAPPGDLTGEFQVIHAITDMDGNGTEDLIVYPSSSSLDLLVLASAGDGATFTVRGTALPTTCVPTAAAPADFDGDGDIDIAMVDACAIGGLAVSVHLWTGSAYEVVLPTIAPPPDDLSVFSDSLGAGDVDGDGLPDLVTSVFRSTTNEHLEVYLSAGDGTFVPGWVGPKSTEAGISYVGDLDGDGDVDIHAGFRIHTNLGDGTFTHCHVPPYTTFFGVTDVNSDGLLEYVTRSYATAADYVQIWSRTP
jgi:hypothetical protein